MWSEVQLSFFYKSCGASAFFLRMNVSIQRYFAIVYPSCGHQELTPTSALLLNIQICAKYLHYPGQFLKAGVQFQSEEPEAKFPTGPVFSPLFECFKTPCLLFQRVLPDSHPNPMHENLEVCPSYLVR